MTSTKYQKSEKQGKYKLMKPKESNSNDKSKTIGLHNFT